MLAPQNQSIGALFGYVNIGLDTYIKVKEVTI